MSAFGNGKNSDEGATATKGQRGCFRVVVPGSSTNDGIVVWGGGEGGGGGGRWISDVCCQDGRHESSQFHHVLALCAGVVPIELSSTRPSTRGLKDEKGGIHAVKEGTARGTAVTRKELA